MMHPCRFFLQRRPQRLRPEFLLDGLKRRGTSSFLGVPDRLLSGFETYLLQGQTRPGEFVVAANAGGAVAMAAGHYLATAQVPCVLMPNRDIGDTMNPILTLMHRDVYRIPCLLLIGWNAKPPSETEEEEVIMAPPCSVAETALRPQGRMTEHCLTAVDIPYSILGPSSDVEMNADLILDKAYGHLKMTATPFAVLIEPGTFDMGETRPVKCDATTTSSLTRSAVAAQIMQQLLPDDALVCGDADSMHAAFATASAHTTSSNGGAVLLLGGGLGHAAAVAAGVALGAPRRLVFCVDGDAAAFAQLGAMAAHGAVGHGLLKHLKCIVVRDDACGVGGGPLTQVAGALGLAVVRHSAVHEENDLAAALQELRQCDGPSFLEIVVKAEEPRVGTPPPLLAHPSAEDLEDLHAERRQFMALLQRHVAQKN